MVWTCSGRRQERIQKISLEMTVIQTKASDTLHHGGGGENWESRGEDPLVNWVPGQESMKCDSWANEYVAGLC